MKTISQINYDGLDINFMETKDEVGYSFGFQGRNYGQKTKVESPTTAKKRQAYIEAIVALFINAIDSYKQLNDTATTTRKRTKGNKPASRNSKQSK